MAQQNIHAEAIVSAFEEGYILALETRIRARARNPRFGYIVKYMRLPAYLGFYLDFLLELLMITNGRPPLEVVRPVALGGGLSSELLSLQSAAEAV